MSWLSRHESLLIYLLIGAGCALRLVWVLSGNHLEPTPSEMFNVAARFAADGVIGDAFRPGQGPTAHVMPLSPILAGTIYRLFGIGSPASELVLTFIALGFVFGSFLCFYHVFRLAGAPAWVRLAALSTACLFPANFSLEASAFRTWEGALAVFLVGLILYRTMRLDGLTGRQPFHRYAILAGLAALAFLVNPASSLAAFAMVALLSWRHGGIKRLAAVGGVGAVALAILFTPWVLRNQQVMGKPLLLRSNFGLVLATGFHDGAIANPDQRQAFRDRLAEVDPLMSDTAYARMKKMGEIPYNRQLNTDAKTWISAHPPETARLMLRYFTQFLYPPQWLWHIYSDESRGTLAKATFHWMVSTLGLCGLLLGLWQDRRRYAYLTTAVILPILPYMLAQPVLRYRYLVFALLLFLSWDFIGRMTDWLRSANQERPAPPAGCQPN